MDVLMRYSLVMIFFSLIVGCTESDPRPPTQEEMLTGTWFEVFQWDDGIPNDVFPTVLGNMGSDASPETTTVTFMDGQYRVNIFPPIRVSIGVQGDSLVNIYSPDTMFVGDYTIDGDVIHCFDDTLALRTRLTFKIENDSLYVHDMGLPQMNDIFQLVSHSFVWGNSWMKNSGVFTRIE